MIDISSLPFLKGKKALVAGIANDQSIAWGCAKAFRAFGADLAMTYRNEKAKKFVEPLAKEVDASIFMPLDLQTEGHLEAIFEQMIADGLALREGDILRLTDRGRLLADSVGAEIMTAFSTELVVA